MDEKDWKGRRRHLAMVMRVTEEEVDAFVGLGLISREDDDHEAALRIDRHRRASARITELLDKLQTQQPGHIAQRHTYANLVGHLIDTRALLGLSQEEIAKRLETSVEVIATMETGFLAISPNLLRRYVSAVGVPLPEPLA